MTQITKLLSLSWLTFEADDLSYTQKLISEPQRYSVSQTATEMSLLRVQTITHILNLITYELEFAADLNRHLAAGSFYGRCHF